MLVRYFILMICALSCFTMRAQEEFVIGELYDMKTNEPIAFATIRLKGFLNGVNSN